MSKLIKTVPVRRSSGKVEDLSPEELEELNYQRKIRDQEQTGHLLTAKQVNSFAVAICIVVMVYAVPRIFLTDNTEQSTYIPLEQRQPLATEPYSGSPISNANTELPESLTLEEEAAEQARLLEQEAALKIAEQQQMIANSIQQWAADWSSRDPSTYLSHYSPNFISDTGMNLEEWRAHRADRISRPTWVQVLITDIDIEVLSDTSAQAQFVQNYSASNYEEVSNKVLALEKIGDSWLISSETNLN